jgi:hypothetical protein
VDGFLPIFFLAVVLKLPVLGAIWLVWWASRPIPEPEGAEDDGGGFGRWRPQPRPPRGPRRGPHGGDARPLPDCPPGARHRVLTPPLHLRPGAARARGADRDERQPAGR